MMHTRRSVCGFFLTALGPFFVNRARALESPTKNKGLTVQITEMWAIPDQHAEPLAFSPDGNSIAAVARDSKKLHVWRAPSWPEVLAAERERDEGHAVP